MSAANAFESVKDTLPVRPWGEVRGQVYSDPMVMLMLPGWM